MTLLSSKKKKLLGSKKNKLSKLKGKSSKNQTLNLIKNKNNAKLVVNKRKAPSKLKKKTLLAGKVEKKKVKKIIKEEEDVIEHITHDGFVDISKTVELSKEDEKILEDFNITFNENYLKTNSKIIDKLQNEIDKQTEEQKQNNIRENILNDPEVKLVYGDIAKLMKEYTSGKLCKPFKAIPLIEQWDKVLEMTRPQEWSPQGMFAATKLFSSSLDIYRAKQFYENYLLPAVRNNIKSNKKLNYHYFQALIKAFYKPAAWFKGLLFPLCKNDDCSIKEAQIFGSILSKLSIPVMHSSVAILKLAETNITGATIIFLKVLVEKKYALPLRVINSLVQYFSKAENIENQMPVVWYQLIIITCQYYSKYLDEMQKSAIKSLVKKKFHHIMTNEIIKVLENKSKEDIMKDNLEKNNNNGEMMIENEDE